MNVYISSVIWLKMMIVPTWMCTYAVEKIHVVSALGWVMNIGNKFCFNFAVNSGPVCWQSAAEEGLPGYPVRISRKWRYPKYISCSQFVFHEGKGGGGQLCVLESQPSQAPPPPYLHTASDQRLEGGIALERGYANSDYSLIPCLWFETFMDVTAMSLGYLYPQSI